MKAKALNFGKAMSAALFVLLLSVVGMKNAFAQTQLATLQHGDSISVYYGQNAFVDAHTAAADGDIVTLSSGSFTVPSTITKAITLRGAGVVSDSIAGTAPTVFTQLVVIEVNNDSIPFQMEGILLSNEMRYEKMLNPKFMKCSFTKINNKSSSSNMSKAQFIDCIIKDFSFDKTDNTTIINSVVWNPTYLSDRTVVFYNSVFPSVSIGNGIISAFNSIIINDHSTNCPGPNSLFINCIGIKLNSARPFGSAYTSDCTIYTSYAAVFDSFTGTFSLEEPFILKDEIATGFLGNDGTQVGIYGGMVPYSNRPTYMVVKRCNVANKSTIDGKLSVDIEVVTEEE